MLRNKHTPLPLHHGGPVGNGGGVNAALDKGLTLLGMAATKTGSGEKEPAYVVKQNSMLKGVLCLMILGVIGLIIIFSTVFEMKIARRGLILSEAVHHQKEHHDHEEIIRTSLELQEALEATIEETALVEEFRAFFEKTVGQSDDQIDRLFQDSGVAPEVIDKAKSLQHEFARTVEVRLGKILNRFQKRAANAREKVVKLAKMMSIQIDEDARDDKRFEKKLQDMGVDEEYAEKLEEQYAEGDGNQDGEDQTLNPGDLDALTEEERNLTPEELQEKRKREIVEQAQEAEKEVEAQLDVFFKKLQALDLPSVKPDAIPKIEKTLDDLMATMGDETKEVDLELFQRKMEQVIAEHAPGAMGGEKYDSEKHDSVVDFYSGFIERAKLYPHRQTLMDLYNGWKSPNSKITALNVLGAIENVAYKDHLMKIFDLLEGNDMDPSTDTQTEHEAPPPLERQQASRKLLANEEGKISKGEDKFS